MSPIRTANKPHSKGLLPPFLFPKASRLTFNKITRHTKRQKHSLKRQGKQQNQTQDKDFGIIRMGIEDNSD